MFPQILQRLEFCTNKPQNFGTNRSKTSAQIVQNFWYKIDCSEFRRIGAYYASSIVRRFFFQSGPNITARLEKNQCDHPLVQCNGQNALTFWQIIQHKAVCQNFGTDKQTFWRKMKITEIFAPDN